MSLIKEKLLCKIKSPNERSRQPRSSSPRHLVSADMNHRGNGCCGTPDPWASSTLTAQLDHFAHQCRPRVFHKKQTPKIGCMVHQREWTKY
ncbi:hypothetical protein CDAR_316161 [Caerostris darwini]|uniref:Uncharacterized protein n=1 Tax=Caerostris darwini TaxID=1538125 RepID=A0AAV4QCS5_9ARAC|nr:hypothetical protein CDAR_316161 [Caerostris darwini]